MVCHCINKNLKLMIDSISFKNFRRFEEFPELKFGDITILVGGNNSGKSTLSKVIDFTVNGIKNMWQPNNNFIIANKKNIMPHCSVGSLGEYSRIHNNNTNNPIEYSISMGKSEVLINKNRFTITIKLKDAEIHDRILKIEKIELIDLDNFISLTISENELSIEYVDTKDNNQIKIEDSEDFNRVLESYKSHNNGRLINNIDAFLYYLRHNIDNSDPNSRIEGQLYKYEKAYQENWLERYNRFLNNIHNDIPTTVINFKSTDGGNILPCISKFVLIQIISESFLMKEWFEDDDPYDTSGKLYNKKCEVENRIKLLIQGLEKTLPSFTYWQLPIHSLEKVSVYTAQHPLYKGIQEFLNKEKQHVLGKENEWGGKPILQRTYGDFFKELLINFNIATDYRINIIAGEVYTFEVLDNNEKWIPLSDIGTGSIRLIEIFLFIINSSSSAVLFIEEPEQNLHPKLQSKLADFFLKVWKELGIKIIVETHSEYLVRRSQVIWAEMNLKDEGKVENPFKVYYFPQEGLPYEMNYLPSGRFENSFGKGFFDEASASALALSRLERRNKNDWN